MQTTFRASTLALIRGRSVPLEACGSDEIALGITATEVLAKPTSLFRVDTLALTRVSAQPSAATPLDVRRDSDGSPVSVDLPRRTGPSILALPQNFNDGWVATIGNKELVAQQVDGWKQGWIIPGGETAKVTLDYRPETTFRIACSAPACSALPGGRLAPAAPGKAAGAAAGPAPGRVGVLDAAVALAAGGLLVGWYGVAAVAVALVAGVAVRRFEGWGGLAAAAMLLVGAGLSWDRITQETWANEWRQAWSLAVVASLVAALATGLGSRVDFRTVRSRIRGRQVRERSRESAPARSQLPRFDPCEEPDVLEPQDRPLEQVEGDGRQHQCRAEGEQRDRHEPAGEHV